MIELTLNSIIKLMNSEKKIIGIQKSERGQAIVLMMLLIVGLVGIAGLAVDGGRLYYSQRTAQNAADNAALAAAWAACAGGDVNSVAFASASSNEFDNNGTTNTVTVYRPPSSGPNVGDDEYIEIVIHSVIDAAFSQLVFSGDLESTVRAVGRCALTGTGPPAQGLGIVVLDSGKDCAIDVDSNAIITVVGSGIFSNSDDNDGAICVDSNAEVNAASSINTVGGYRIDSNAIISPLPSTGSATISDPLADLPPPAKPSGSCTTIDIGSNDNETIGPGLYCSIKVDSNAQLTMTAGEYYIEGGNFEINSNGSVTAQEVIFYMDQGKFRMESNSSIDLTPPTSGDYAGMIIYMDRDTGGEIHIHSNGSIESTGTIYGANSKLHINSNSGINLGAQIIVNEMEVKSNGIITVTYDENSVYGGGVGTPTIELAE